jgi:hypothetical protein
VPPSPPTIATNTESSKKTLSMGLKCHASTKGKTAQDSKPTPGFKWKCPHCSYTNDEDMLKAVFGDTSEARQTCIMCYNLSFPSSDEDSLAKN